MGMFIVLLGVFAIILTATCSAFGVSLPEPKPESKKKDNSFFKDDIDDEILDESCGMCNHGHGFYKPIKSNLE